MGSAKQRAVIIISDGRPVQGGCQEQPHQGGGHSHVRKSVPLWQQLVFWLFLLQVLAADISPVLVESVGAPGFSDLLWR